MSDMKLSLDQEDLFRDYVAKARQVCMRTDPIDRAVAEDATKDLLSFLNQEVDGFQYVVSPRSGYLTCMASAKLERLFDGIADRKDVVRPLLPGFFDHYPRQAISAQFGRSPIFYATGQIVYYYAHKFMQEIGVRYTDDEKTLIDLSINLLENTGGMLLSDYRTSHIQDRPKTILLDPNGNIHSQSEAAVTYRGTHKSFYYWHGQQVPGDWIRETPPVREVMHHRNEDVIAAGCEILGWHEVIEKINPRMDVIDKHKNPEIGELVEVRLMDFRPKKFLRVKCGTGKPYALPVSNDMRTAHQANAWLHGLSVEEYNPEVRT